MKNLRQKLIIIISTMALLSIANVGVTLWSVIQWQQNNKKLTVHYQSSLILNTIQSNIFLSFKEPYDALTKGDPDAYKDFEQYSKPFSNSFAEWSKVVEGHPMQNAIAKMEKAYAAVLKDIQKFFGLIEKKEYQKAAEFMENQMELDSMPGLIKEIQNIIEQNRLDWATISDKMARTRELAKLILAIITLSTVSLLFLKIAYMLSDLFSPIRKLKQAIENVSSGDFKFRLDEERRDELGELNTAFNKLIDGFQAKISLYCRHSHHTKKNGQDGFAPAEAHSPLLPHMDLQKSIFRLRSQLSHLIKRIPAHKEDGASSQMIKEINHHLETIASIAEYSCPLDLNLSETDIRLMIHQTLVRFQSDLIKKRINISMEIDTHLETVVVDELKLRLSIGELLQNSIESVSKGSGTIELGAYRSGDGNEFMIYVEDNRPQRREISKNNDEIGFQLAESIIRQHGGQLVFENGSNSASRAQMSIPIIS